MVCGIWCHNSCASKRLKRKPANCRRKMVSSEEWSRPIGSACHATRLSPPDSSGRSTSLPFSMVAPARTWATRCGALTARQQAWAGSMSLNALATPAAALEPGPLVTRWRSLTVAKVDSIGLVLRRWIQCSVG